MGGRLMRLNAALLACLLMLGAGGSAVRAAPADVTYETLETFEVTSPCTGEVLSISGTIQLVFRLSATPSRRLHLVIVERAHDWTVNDTIGNIYLSTGQPAQFIVNWTSTSASLSLTLVNRQWFITPGGDANIMVRRVQHLQITPDGTVTEFHDVISTECRG